MSRANRKDNNHAEIVAALRQVGAVVLDVAQYAPALGVDLIVSWRGQTWYIEVKASPKYLLTPNERSLQDELKRVDVTYYIVTDVDHVLAIMGANR